MALKKLCRCGKLVTYEEGMCPECKVKNEDRKNQKNKEYKIARQDRDIQAIYNSKTWKIITKTIENRDKKLCLLCLDNKQIRYKDTVHHIIELKEDTRKAFVKGNLICLCESCHQKVHKAYRHSNQVKLTMQEKLRNLLERPRGL